MAPVPKKVIERFKKSIAKFQKVLQIAKDRDINEADTVSIIQDMLSDIFGFQKYLEITSEYSIRNLYCDLAIRIDDKIQYLIEVKAIGIALKDSHLRQAVEYGANKGVQWVVLTNGILWELYKIRFEKPISYDLVSSLNLLNIIPRSKEDQEKLYLFTKEGLGKSVREDYYERVQSVNRFVFGALILSEPIINVIKRDIKKLSSGVKVETQEIEKILKNEVLKRDVVEGDEAIKAFNKVRKLSRKIQKHQKTETPVTVNDPNPKKISFSDQLLADNQKKSG